jgi:outer membrane protein assembly factor BamB
MNHEIRHRASLRPSTQSSGAERDRCARRTPGGWALSAAVAAAVAAVAVGTLAAPAPCDAADWTHWRGPARNGTSPETGLPSSWSKEGENLIWRQDFTGRSTPVVFAGRVCANGRAGEGISRQEMVACFDAASGGKLWEKRWPVYHTTVPWNRVGWPNPVIDPETGYLYVQGVGGLFFCFDSADGREIWSRPLIEQLGFMEGYGGRTQTPLVDEDRVIVTFASTNWGDQSRPLHRMYAFDKLTGEAIWASSPAPSMADKNSQSTPAVAVVNGRRLVIQGNGDGTVYAVESRTGKPVWSFRLSKVSINTSVLVDGATVYAAHSEENVDEPTMGRVVAIDASGEGDVTATHEKWRAPLGVGFPSPALAGGVLYLIDNSANLFALDAADGRQLWQYDLGTVGKASPVVADGKLYAAEVNGRFHILEVSRTGAKPLDHDEITMPGSDRYAELYGSPAIAYGRVYFTTEEGIYALGDPGKPFVADDGDGFDPGAEEPPGADAAPATLLVIPAEAHVAPGETVAFRVAAFDAKGRALGSREVTWSLDGLTGTVLPDGRFTAASDQPWQAGKAIATAGGLTGAGRVRVAAPLPLADDFESWPAGGKPTYLNSYLRPFVIGEVDGGKVLSKVPIDQLNRHHTLLGPPALAGYTIKADVMGTREGRRVPDVGLIDAGYTMELMGAHQKIQVRSWAAELRMAEEVPFPWETDTWYTMKLRVDQEPDKTVVRGKVWKRDEPEPEAWTITVEDPYPIQNGSPGLVGYSPAPIHWDNLSVTVNAGAGVEGSTK